MIYYLRELFFLNNKFSKMEKSFLLFLLTNYCNYQLLIYLMQKKYQFLGKYLNPEFIPWYYFFLWFFLTTPIFFSILIIFGLFLFLRNFLRSFLRINNNTKDLLWKNRIEMNEVYFFYFFLFLSFS